MFERQPTLSDATLTLRPLVLGDFDGLYAAGSDPKTWAGHHAPDRHLPNAFQSFFDVMIESCAALAIVNRSTDQIIGCSRYYTAPDRPDTIAIGFTFLHHSYWGGVTNLAVKTLMHDHAFASFDDVWFHIGPDNIRSQKATAKLGAQFVEDVNLNLGGSPAAWKVYRLSRDAWINRRI